MSEAYPSEADMTLQKSSLVLLVLVNHKLCGEGIKKLLAGEQVSNKRIVVHCSVMTLGCLHPDIILLDADHLSQELFSLYPDAKMVVLDPGFNQDEIEKIFEKFLIYGLLTADSDIDSCKKAFEAICRGELWLKPGLVRKLLHRSHLQAKNSLEILTERERELIQYLCAGLSNKDIASAMHVQESTVKAHLHRIYKKLQIRARSQLILLAMNKSEQQD